VRKGRNTGNSPRVENIQVDRARDVDAHVVVEKIPLVSQEAGGKPL